ncbi:tripartite motif-containing protein 5-like isoform X2 [Eriocheir sinensis]|uniref:tripartite motif-containing protein 5-like isoform X2 n=1 Tax=Eriocheir sinensis TaxID=95602 RepID=UPI0021C5EB43|nr:tripartite motif-containing protein 5-like isoform X2 [Eriocheir sinensis]
MAAAGKGRSTGDNPEDCPVCLTNFDDTVQRPHNLPCGHTVCMLCIDKLKEQGRVICPECRVSHAVPEGGQFPVSYIAEAFIKRTRDAKVATAASLLPSAKKRKGTAEAADKKEVTGFSKKMRSFLQEQEATVVAAITACREAQSQLDQYQTTLTGWGKRQQHLEDRLQGLVDQSRSARGLVQQENSRTTAMEVKVKEVEQALQAMQETLRTLKTEQEAGVVVTEVFRCTGEAEQVVQECQECFPDASTVTTARKLIVASTAALETSQAVQAALETPTVTTEEPRPQSDPAEPRPQSDPAEPRPQSDPESTIMDRVKLILTLNLKAEDLRSLSQPPLSLIQAGRVFAVHQVKGQRRLARISLEAGRLCLHTLKEQHHSLDAATLQVSWGLGPPCGGECQAGHCRQAL